MRYILDFNTMPEHSLSNHFFWLKNRKIDPYNTLWKRLKEGESLKEEGKWLYETETGQQIFTREEFFKPVLGKDLSKYM